MRRLRILLQGTDPEPQTVRIPFISYRHGAVLAQLQTLPWSFERAWTLAALQEGESKRMILSKNWAPFYCRIRRARFIHNSFVPGSQSLEWLLRKMGENLHMQNATWLVSSELAEAAGPWDESLNYDQDGEYFARLLVKSEGTRFVAGTGIFYRVSGAGSISYIGKSDKKRISSKGKAAIVIHAPPMPDPKSTIRLPRMLSRCFSAVARRPEATSMAIDSKVSIRYARFP